MRVIIKEGYWPKKRARESLVVPARMEVVLLTRTGVTNLLGKDSVECDTHRRSIHKYVLYVCMCY